jgi:anti-anti-sigma regulatory factor
MILPAVASMSPAFPLSWSTERLAGSRTVVVAVSGELDRQTSPALRDHLEWLLAGTCDRLVLDTGAVTVADGGAHDLLRALGRRAIERPCRVVVAALGAPLQRLLDIIGAPDGITVERW